MDNKCVEPEETDSGVLIDATTDTTVADEDQVYYGFCCSLVYSGEGGE